MLKNIFTAFLISFLSILPAVLISADGQHETEDSVFASVEQAKELPAPVRKALEEGKEKRRSMVIYQIYNRGVQGDAVIKAMLSVPRHIFVPAEYTSHAYADQPLPIGYGQTISQPYIVALMTEALGIKPGDRVLEIGTGSGYQSAVLSVLTGNVYTIEIVEELYKRTSKLYRTFGYNTIHTRQGDGYHGWEAAAPFDAIIVTAAAGHVPPPLIKQLKPGGRIVIPVGSIFDVQMLVVVNKDEKEKITTEQLLPVRFVPMTGVMLNNE